MDQTGERSGDRHQPTSQQSSHMNHSHTNDRYGSDRRGGSDNHRSSNNNYSGSNNRNSGYGRDQRKGVSSPTDLPILVPSNPGVPLRATPTQFALLVDKDCKKNTTAGTSGQADKKPGASGHIFAITEGHAANTSGTIMGTLFIYRHAVFVLFDTGATHSVISSAFALRVTTTPTLLDHNTMLQSTVVPIELSLVTFMHLSLFIMVPYRESLCRLFRLNLNASYVNEKINLEDDYFQEIINPDFDKIDSSFKQTSSLKPYVPNAILENIIIDLEDEVVNLLEKEKVNLEIIDSLKSKGFESSENIKSETENQIENDCFVVEKECNKEENP
nr:hypothetical protein [Tanacetum cinerariifolium]